MEEIIRELEALKERMQSEGQEAIHSHFQKFFDANPIVTGVVWEQYTPYFNDGDVCMFRVGDLRIKVSPETLEKYGLGKDKYDDPEALADPNDYGYEGTLEGAWQFRESEPAFYQSFRKLTDDMDRAEELFELVFGDHSRVVVTREGIEVLEYEHE